MAEKQQNNDESCLNVGENWTNHGWIPAKHRRLMAIKWQKIGEKPTKIGEIDKNWQNWNTIGKLDKNLRIMTKYWQKVDESWLISAKNWRIMAEKRQKNDESCLNVGENWTNHGWISAKHRRLMAIKWQKIGEKQTKNGRNWQKLAKLKNNWQTWQKPANHD